MSDFKFFIRFGVHKDRDVIKELMGSIDGVCVPAHIFSYSPEPTVYAALTMNKNYFIDPMTYLYSDQDIEDYVTTEEEGGRQFKPSVRKLTTDYQLLDFFKQRDFKKLEAVDMTENMIDEWVARNLFVQLEKIKENKESTIKRYTKILQDMGLEFPPVVASNEPTFIVPPYFHFSSVSDPWFDINIQFAKRTREKQPNDSIFPIVLTNSGSRNKDLIIRYKNEGFKMLLVWVDDLNEKEVGGNGTQIGKLISFANFIGMANEEGVKIINLYGSYYSVLLGKIGLGGMCNGIFYGEYKSRKSKVGGGPQSRYYVRKLHDFIGLVPAISLLQDKKGSELLDTETPECMKLINGNPKNIFLFDSDHSLAQRHFVFSRRKELKNASIKTLHELLVEIDHVVKEYTEVVSKASGTKKLDYLVSWRDALKGFE